MTKFAYNRVDLWQNWLMSMTKLTYNKVDLWQSWLILTKLTIDKIYLWQNLLMTKFTYDKVDLWQMTCHISFHFIFICVLLFEIMVTKNIIKMLIIKIKIENFKFVCFQTFYYLHIYLLRNFKYFSYVFCYVINIFIVINRFYCYWLIFIVLLLCYSCYRFSKYNKWSVTLFIFIV